MAAEIKDRKRGERVTIAQLIEELSAFEPDTLVLVDGYEGNFSTPDHPYEMPVDPEPHLKQGWYMGCWVRGED